MSVILSNYKKPEQANYYRPSNLPQARNPVYQKEVSLGCKFCVDKPGRKKIYHTLYSLHHHFTHEHSKEPSYRDISIRIADLIIEGTIL